MDNLTHTLFAATLARTPLRRAGRGTTAALLIASNVPDLDAISAVGGAVSYLKWHRGPTHGLLGIVGLGALTAAIVWAAQRWLDARRLATRGPHDADGRPPAAGFGMLLVVAMIGVALHILMDLPTSYGTRLLSPFDWHWYAFDWLPIIDVYLLGALAAGLLGARGGPAVAQRLAGVVLALMAANYGLRAAAHHQALATAPALFGPLLPATCEPGAPAVNPSMPDRWPRAAPRLPRAGEKPCLIELAAVPTFLSPFRWRVVAQLSNAYELHEIDLLDGRLPDTDLASRLWRLTVRYPDQWRPVTLTAAETRTAQAFLGFSRFPAARTFVDPTGAATVRWADMRFAGGIFSLQAPRRPDLFTVSVRLRPDGSVAKETLGQ